MQIILYLELDGEKIINCGSSPATLDYRSVIVDTNHEINRTVVGWYFIDGELVKKEDEVQNELLNKAKIEKDIELNNACNNSILNGFEHKVNGIPYHFSFDIEAQFNFQGGERALSKGLTENIPWTVTNKLTGEHERISINNDLMDELSLAILIHKNSNVSKYRDFLYVRLTEAKTIEEVNSINW